MLRAAAMLALVATLAAALAACGQGPMGASEEAAAPADAPVSAGPDYAGDFDAVGTEPFWTVKIRADGLALTRPDHPEITNPNPGVRPEGEQGVWESTSDGGRLRVRLTPGACSDGMSDRAYGYFAQVSIDGEALKGCAERTAVLAAQPKP